MIVKRIGVTGMLVLGLATLAGSATATSLNHRLDQALANRLTLHLADMPTGWGVHPPSKSSGSKCSAFKGKSVKSATTAKAKTFFSGGTDLALSVAGVVTTVAIAKRGYAEIADFARSCLHEIPKVKNISVSPMSFPRFGDQSNAWSLKGTDQGVNVYFNIILVRIQRAVAIYIFGGIGGGDPSLEVGLVRKATARA
jgi:hypothetical protein